MIAFPPFPFLKLKEQDIAGIHLLLNFYAGEKLLPLSLGAPKAYNNLQM